MMSSPDSFDLEEYQSRMAEYLDSGVHNTHLFFEALDFAFTHHKNQTRKSGLPYISHPAVVAEILARELSIKDPLLLAAALLHDIVEDVPQVSIGDVERRFGGVVAELVDGCTKLSRQYLDRTTLKNLTHGKIFLSAGKSPGIIIIKLADRLHNLRTLHFLPQTQRQRIAQETVEVYAPLAAKLNIFLLKRELYHLALYFLFPRLARKITYKINQLTNSWQIRQIKETLRDQFAHLPFETTIRSRAKGLESYYDPKNRILDLSHPENVLDITLVVHSENLRDCFAILGIVSSTYKTIPRSIRDFIANPKKNGYRSLHIRIHVDGQNYLVKIRTLEMDQWANAGVGYLLETSSTLAEEPQHELKELLYSIGKYSGSFSQRKTLLELSERDEIIVYSPRKDIFPLPRGSIVLDFAYRIHSALGEYCQGALVNNEKAPVTRKLNYGDRIKILTSPNPLPVNPFIEKCCQTPKARTAVNSVTADELWTHPAPISGPT